MNTFKKLKQYPLSIPLLEKWMENFYVESNRKTIITNEFLVDFLDSKGIYIEISVKCALDNSIWFTPDVFFINMGIDREIYFREYKSRLEATEVAIDKAFYLLEQKLKIN